MKRFTLTACAALCFSGPAFAQQVPNATPDIPVSGQDRFYTSDQFSNTVSVIDPATNRLLGVIRLGDPTPANLSPLYQGAAAGPRHGLLARPQDARGGLDRLELGDLHRHRDQRREAHDLCRPLAARGVLHARRQEVWVTVRGEDYVPVLDGTTFEEKHAHHRAERAGHDDLLAGRQIRLRLLELHPRDGRDRRPRTIRSSGASSRPARSAPTSPRRPTASRSGSR